MFTFGSGGAHLLIHPQIVHSNGKNCVSTYFAINRPRTLQNIRENLRLIMVNTETDVVPKAGFCASNGSKGSNSWCITRASFYVNRVNALRIVSSFP